MSDQISFSMLLERYQEAGFDVQGFLKKHLPLSMSNEQQVRKVQKWAKDIEDKANKLVNKVGDKNDPSYHQRSDKASQWFQKKFRTVLYYAILAKERLDEEPSGSSLASQLKSLKAELVSIVKRLYKYAASVATSRDELRRMKDAYNRSGVKN